MQAQGMFGCVTHLGAVQSPRLRSVRLGRQESGVSCALSVPQPQSGAQAALWHAFCSVAPPQPGYGSQLLV